MLDKRSGTELLQAGGGGNELVLQPEHPAHPRWAEGPWLLCPAGPGTGTGLRPATVRAERCPAGSRLVAEQDLGGLVITQETLLWDGADRVEFRTHVDGSIGQDRLLRVVFPVDVPGGLPVYQTAVAVIGRPPGPIDSDVAEHSYTLDSPANEWLAVGSTAAVALTGQDGSRQLQAIGVAEVVAPPSQREPARALMAALAGQGVTATCSLPDGPRYGYQELDSNLPDFRICLGGPDENALTALRTGRGGAGRRAQRSRPSWPRAAPPGSGCPAQRSRAAAFGPGADLRAPLDLPVLIVAGADLGAQTQLLAADLSDAVIEVPAMARPPVQLMSARLMCARPTGGRSGDSPGAAYGRAAEPRYAQRPGHPGRPADHGTDARLQHLALRRLDRRQEADDPGRHQLRLAALEPHVRVRAGRGHRDLADRRLRAGRPGLQPRPADGRHRPAHRATACQYAASKHRASRRAALRAQAARQSARAGRPA